MAVLNFDQFAHWVHWTESFNEQMVRLRAADSPPTAYAHLIHQISTLPCPLLGEFLQIAENIPARTLEEFLSEGGDRQMRGLDNCTTYVRAPMCVAASLAREETAARARWAMLRVAWVAAVMRTPRAAPGATEGS